MPISKPVNDYDAYCSVLAAARFAFMASSALLLALPANILFISCSVLLLLATSAWASAKN
jgi:hypothetical protein